MAYTYHGTSNLIALPNRTVQTYPSGLVRVERSFICRKADVAKNRNTIRVNERMPMDDGAPAFDGLFIFPEPQENVRDDGFVEFRVTAYGRTRTPESAVIERSSELGVFTSISERPSETTTTTFPAINEVYSLKFVASADELASAILNPPRISDPLVFRLRPTLTQVVPRYQSSTNPTVSSDVTISVQIDSFSSVPFGRWLEVTSVYKASGRSFTIFFAS